jgi:fructose-bisphosphate aldolase class I
LAYASCCCSCHAAGLAPLPVSPEESFTQGFDNLAARCAAYNAAGASFAKWRAVINIRKPSAAAPGLPSEAAVAAAARGLAMYAAISQSAGLVPIVEPEVLADGDHGIELCEAVTHRVLAAVFKELADAGEGDCGCC